MDGARDELIRLAGAWRGAMARGGVRRGLEEIYLAARAEIESRGPACWASGRCCRFDRVGHRLYATGLEAAYAMVRLEEGGGSRGPAARAPGEGGRPITLAQVGVARERGDCPYLEGNACGIHEIKPLGCRVYFCDRGAQGWQGELSERLLERVRSLHDAHGVEYRYAEWRDLLEAFAREES